MAERFVIVVTPPDGDNGSLTVADAMRQVMDVFELLIASSESNDSVTWRLVEAKTNSPPFSVIGEARSTRLGIDVDLIAKTQKNAFVKNYSQLMNGTIPESWGTSQLTKVAENFIARSRNGIDKTEIKIDDDRTLTLTKDKALNAQKAFEIEAIEKIKPYSQIGSIEGILLGVTSYYSYPAIRVKERISGDVVWCMIEEEHRKQIVEEADFDDVWSGRRVRIRGKLEYNDVGNLDKVLVSEIIPMNPRNVSLNEIKDTEFTGGLAVSEYIDKLREGYFE